MSLWTPNRFSLVALAAIALLAAAAPASAGKTFTTLYAFAGGTDGAEVLGPVIADASGNLYGTTQGGGDLSIRGGRGCGTVFKLAPNGIKTILHVFEAGRKDGSHPSGALLLDGKGNLYGTTQNGGGNNPCRLGCGTVFKIAPDGTESVLHAFSGGANDGGLPYAGVIKDRNGNLYGTTSTGGTGCNEGCGTVFMLSKTGVETVLHFFDGNDGNGPGFGSLLRDADGNLYGTTGEGGDFTCPTNSFGCGTAFKLAPGGAVTVLHAFAGAPSDGARPSGGLVADANGNLYGTTEVGGAAGCNGNGCGTLYKLAPDGTETILHSFAGGDNDGIAPEGTLLKAGNFLGTTQVGGSDNLGTIYKLSADGHYSLLHTFSGGDGDHPLATLLGGAGGTLFGTTEAGGNDACQLGCGTVFKLQ